MTVEAQKETLGFQAEVKQLLDLMIHSLYSHKEIFLRELISNASDAIDRLRFDALSDPSLYERDADFKIRVSYDKEARTITICDNGIGMSRNEVIEHIGTIARSGTKEFFKSLTGDKQKDANLIGQFGVGFYSSFVVADKVTLTTRRAGTPASEGVRWESDGKGEYSLETVEKPTRGTEVTLHLREDESEFLDGYRLRSIIRKYSDHIQLPIYMPVEDKEKQGEEEVVNKASALWTRSKSEISDQEYKEFYKHISHDFSDPLTYLHSKMEGTQEYTMLLYVPGQAPFDLWTREHHHGVKLYVRRVFIMDDAEKLMPRYLRFIRGVIDSNDLPLNVSREILQQNRLIDLMRSNATKKILGLLNDMATKEPEKYETFWREFGRVLKEGIIEDHSNRDTLAKLLRFSSTFSESDKQDVSLETYVKRMKEGQDKIYYLIAESYTAAKSSPLLEIFKQKGIEVLLFTDPIDHFIETELREFDGKQLQSVSKGEIDLSKFTDEKEKEEQQKTASEAKDLIERLKTVLGDKVKDVRTTNRLTSSPACLVVDQYGIDPSLKRLLEANGQRLPQDKQILEINPQHAIIQKIKQETDEQRFQDWAHVLFEQSQLSSGEPLEDPVGFVNRLNNLLAQS
ncbi:molecular chaperone HtpG [Thermosporothrix hazakensis]|jgi:molecular chaperone HtpG|uniref:Chaperone protein HtpG n=2 Tax=Thermosporothrix TaxID=768650 RepID=A0A326UAI3_THEHA|nr:molecular chaperone HtpG [Thermosporothrix hazakensis]PZW32832.1 molecular chaperone HtpG [Thermosporothrix hazakensis]BBH90813.1 chaperone protein HtpG [Thermosporothrix sp. COM3]GCE48863.1 chaperone protein HtpG [Thermosporothrix hazakensis]